jgi:hypothetical protein
MDRLGELAAMLSACAARRAQVWDTLWARQSIGRIAVAVLPGSEAVETAKTGAAFDLVEPTARPPAWHDALVADLAALQAGLRQPGDAFPALSTPRSVHGQSQGICDLFGARVEPQADGNVFVHPLPSDPSVIAALSPHPLETSRYWGAVEYLRYARAATRGLVPFRGPIMTGPFDTANYLLGTTTLLEWVYTEPEVVHGLLDTITAVIVGMVRALRDAAGGTLHAHHLACLRGGFDLASECRSLVSAAIYEQFEAPYLRRIGTALGPYGIHSCGSWERTVAGALQDPNLRAMHGQIRENDLAQLCGMSAGRMTLSIGRSVNVAERFLWPDTESFYAFILKTVPPHQPLEIGVPEHDLPLWNALCRTLGAERNLVPVAGAEGRPVERTPLTSAPRAARPAPASASSRASARGSRRAGPAGAAPCSPARRRRTPGP